MINKNLSIFNDHVEDNEKERNLMHEYVDRVDQDLGIYKNYMDTFNDDKVVDLFKATAEEMLPDNN